MITGKYVISYVSLIPKHMIINDFWRKIYIRVPTDYIPRDYSLIDYRPMGVESNEKEKV